MKTAAERNAAYNPDKTVKESQIYKDCSALLDFVESKEKKAVLSIGEWIADGSYHGGYNKMKYEPNEVSLFTHYMEKLGYKTARYDREIHISW